MNSSTVKIVNDEGHGVELVFDERDHLQDDVVQVTCWCELRLVRVDRSLVGTRTYPCTAHRCRRMNAEYESRKRCPHGRPWGDCEIGGCT